MKPIIAVTPCIEKGKYNLNVKYTEAVEKAGGVPFILPYGSIGDIGFILSKVDGVLLSGGGDMDPVYFNQPVHPKTELVEKIRDEFEVLLCKSAIAENMPLLAVCRGVQVMNVVLGGTLVQDIANHSFPRERDVEKHFVDIKKESKLYGIFKTEKLKVNSIHHQAIGETALCLDADAVSEDGVVEAVEMRGSKFTLGVQWHPEILESHNLIFKSFVEACKEEGC